MGKPKFEIFKGKDEHFFFHLKAGNGEVILASQGYTAKANAQKGVASVAANSSDESNFEMKALQRFSGEFQKHSATLVGISSFYNFSSGIF